MRAILIRILLPAGVPLIPVAEGSDVAMAMDLEANLQGLVSHMMDINARAESLAARHDSVDRRINELRAELLQGYPTEIGPEVTRTLDELGVPPDHFLRGIIAASMRSAEGRALQEHEPPPWTAAEALHLSEAEQLLSERNECKIQVDRCHQALQVLDGHNRVLQHLLCEARRGRRGHCPRKRGAWCPRSWQWWGTRCPRTWRNCIANSRGPLQAKRAETHQQQAQAEIVKSITVDTSTKFMDNVHLA